MFGKRDVFIPGAVQSMEGGEEVPFKLCQLSAQTWRSGNLPLSFPPGKDFSALVKINYHFIYMHLSEHLRS